ncbi:ectonucleotide pyrophosphatase/phosphodiesterase family member 5-like protein, partial [Dinothrombium tinctorium]
MKSVNDYFNEKETPNMYKFYRNGVWGRNMKSTYVTKTNPSHFSMVTGYYQETHGVVGSIMFDPLFNETFTQNTKGSKWWDNGLSIPIWNANQMAAQQRFSYASSWPGSLEAIGGQRAHYIDSFVNHLKWENAIDKTIKLMLDKKTPVNLALVHYDEPEETAQDYGPFSNETKQQIKQVDKLIGYLLDSLSKSNLLNDTNIMIVSDHGMAEVHFENLIDLSKITNKSLYRLFGSSPVFNVLANEGKKDLVYKMLVNASKNNHFVVYKREEVPKEYHYSNHRRILDFVIEAEEGYFFSEKKEKWFPHKYFGAHGYNNSLFSMR